MKWIPIIDSIPEENSIIVAIMDSRLEQNGDPIEWADIVILRFECKEFRNMTGTEIYYLPSDNKDWYETIKYWILWKDFGFPESMINAMRRR